ncbi:MAG: AraC family transcriptional regulator [Puniceicoccaceae bacterium 5H]|nr:MAG: AraC family transcriptional regulator [Puniceicoccaceae bacterium 5H]
MERLQELRDLISRHCSGTMLTTALPRVGLFKSVQPSNPVHALYEPRLCVIAQGRKYVTLGEEVLEYNEANYLIASLDLPVAGCVCEASEERPYLSFCLNLDISIIASMLAELPPATSAAVSGSGISVTPIDDQLLEPSVRLLKLLDRPDDIPMLAPLIEREILYRVLTGPQGAQLRQIALGEGRMARLSRAIAWIRAHYNEPLDVEYLAEVANMSQSSFFRHFKAATSLSPLQYQKNIRLQAARRLMLTRQEDAANIGFTVGYESPSQFSREYSRMFGAPPARDAARMREAMQEADVPLPIAL